MDNTLDPNVRPHTTHFACDERIAKYGGQTVGCCCTGHVCQVAITEPVDGPKEYTGHKSTKMENGQTVVEWLRDTIRNECKYYGVPELTDRQVAVVISSMRMHTLIMRAASYDTSELGKPNEVTKYWPIESSVGRFFRDAARDTLDEQQG